MERLPSWAAGLEPVDFSWNASAEAAGNSVPSAAASRGLKDGLQLLQERPMSNASCWTANSAAAMSSKVSDNSTQDLLSADRRDQWDPTPSMPDMDREEAMEFMSDYGLVDQPAAEQGITEGAAGLSQSAPTTSEIDSAEGDDSKEPHDDSKFSRSRSQPYTAEQKQVKARESQKRFRMRQKARSQAIEARLASTAAELHSLKLRQQQLESRNQLLEKFSHVGNQQTQLDGDGLYERLYIVHETDALESGPSITISVDGAPRSMTVQDISQMSLKQFAFLWTEYVRKIGACLVQLEQSHDNKVKALMEKLTNESSRLIGCIKLLNHDVHRAMLMGRMDESLSNSHKLGAAFYTNLSRMMNLTDAQRQDMIYLRRIYLTRRCLHAMERQALLAQAAINRDQMPLPSDNLTHVSDLATRLQKNATEDYRVYHRVACAGRRGVVTTKQWAILIVQSYPYLPILETHFEAIAAEGGAPSKAQILAAAQTNPMAAEWRHLNKYLESIASRNSDEHIPLVDRAANIGSSIAAPSGLPIPGGFQQGEGGGQRGVGVNAHSGHGLPGLLDPHGGRSDTSNPPFSDAPVVVHPMAAPLGQAGAPANMLCGNTAVPFRLDPAVAALPPMPVYRQQAAYLFQNDPMQLQQQPFGSNLQQRLTDGALRQDAAANTSRSHVTTPFSQSAPNMPFTLPHLL